MAAKTSAAVTVLCLPALLLELFHSAMCFVSKFVSANGITIDYICLNCVR